MHIKAWLAVAWREPLVQFGILGSMLYLAAQATGGGSLQIPVARLEDSRAKMSRLLERSDSPEAIRRESDLRVVGDELLYREALRLGLDRGDPVIRQHLAQKLLGLAEEAALAGREPTLVEEQALFAQRRGDWTLPSRITFCHVFSSRGWTKDAAASIAVRRDEASCDGRGGEAFPLGALVGPYSEAELAGQFGADFARAVFDAPPDRWAGPLASRFGAHLVRVTVVTPEMPPDFAERRVTLRQAWAQRERAQARAELLRRLAERDRPEAGPEASPELRRDVARALAQLVR